MKILCVSDQIDPLIYTNNAKKNFPDIDLILCAGDLPLDYVDFIVSVFNKPALFVFGNHDLKEYKYYRGLARFFGTEGQESKACGALYAGFSCITIKNMQHGLPKYATYRKEDKKKSVGEWIRKRDYKLKISGEEIKVIFSEEGMKDNSNSIDKKKVSEYNREEKSKSKRGKRRGEVLIIVGVSGTRRYNNGECQYTEAQMKRRLFLLIPKLLYNKVRYGRFLDIFLTHSTPEGIHDGKDPCHAGFEVFNWFLKVFTPALMVHGHIHLYDSREERCALYYDTVILNAYAHCVVEI